jgi:mycothiol synthase
MRRHGLDALPTGDLPEGYALRTYRPGDEEAWLSILARSDFGAWDRARLDRMLASDPAPLPCESIHFATLDDRPIASANCFVYPALEGPYSMLGWVAVDPDHRGRGLARCVCLGVMHYASRSGHTHMFLKTEDHRLPAIKTYLRLGFVADIMDDSQPQRWREIKAAIGMS